MPGLFTTGFKENGIDIGQMMVEKSYLMDSYPQLVDWQKAPGLWGWGYNYSGQLGDGTNSTRSSPVQTVAGGTNWKQVACGGDHTGIIKTDGTLWTFGYNYSGQLGDNTTDNKSSPVQTVTGGTNWKQVSCGASHTAAIKTDGTLWTWGRNYYGSLGDGDSWFNSQKSSPVQTVAGGTNWKQVACGGQHTTAIKTDGTLWTWGKNILYQLGDGTNTNRSSPVQTVSGGTNWKEIGNGYRHSAAIKTNGTLWLWGGNNNDGQIGDETIEDRNSPVQTVAGGTNWKQVAGGRYHTVAVKFET